MRNGPIGRRARVKAPRESYFPEILWSCVSYKKVDAKEIRNYKSESNLPILFGWSIVWIRVWNLGSMFADFLVEYHFQFTHFFRVSLTEINGFTRIILKVI